MSPENIYSPDIALKAADAFRSHSQIFIGSLGNSLDRAAQHAAQNLGDFIASATMLSLALELYLKALRATINITIPETHDLWALYKKLPQELKKSIECSYTKINSNNEEKLAGLELAIWVGRQPPIDDPPEVNKEKEKTDSYNDLRSVLFRSRNAFQTWRYLHEMGKKNCYVLFKYEFHRLGLICDIIREHILKIHSKAML